MRTADPVQGPKYGKSEFLRRCKTARLYGAGLGHVKQYAYYEITLTRWPAFTPRAEKF